MRPFLSNPTSWAVRLLVPQLLIAACGAQGESFIGPQEVIAQARAKLGSILPSVPPLEMDRMGNLRQETFAIQESLGVTSDKLQDVEFFEVFPSMYSVVEGRVQLSSVTLDDNPRWLIAKNTGRWFFLYGFENNTTVGEFNHLVRALGVGPKTEQQALELFDYYLKVAKAPAYRASIPVDELSLQAIVSREYLERYSIEKRQAKFRQWWNQSASVRKKLSPPRVRRVGNRFQVTFFRYLHDEVIDERISFGMDGEIDVAPK